MHLSIHFPLKSTLHPSIRNPPSSQSLICALHAASIVVPFSLLLHSILLLIHSLIMHTSIYPSAIHAPIHELLPSHCVPVIYRNISRLYLFLSCKLSMFSWNIKLILAFH